MLDEALSLRQSNSASTVSAITSSSSMAKGNFNPRLYQYRSDRTQVPVDDGQPSTTATASNNALWVNGVFDRRAWNKLKSTEARGKTFQAGIEIDNENKMAICVSSRSAGRGIEKVKRQSSHLRILEGLEEWKNFNVRT